MVSFELPGVTCVSSHGSKAIQCGHKHSPCATQPLLHALAYLQALLAVLE